MAEISFKNVSKTYGLTKALENVSFTCKEGEFFSIFGPSGAGKSTIFDLTQRFYDPTSGSIKINGAQIKDFSLQEIRDKMGYVSQDPVLFSGSLKSNLLYVNRRVSEEDLREALELAKVDFVDDLQLGITLGFITGLTFRFLFSMTDMKKTTHFEIRRRMGEKSRIYCK